MGNKHVLIIGEGAGKMKEKLREMFRAVEVGKDVLFDEPSLVEEEKEFRRFMEMHRRFCEEVGVASVTLEKEITARQMVEAVERMRTLRVKPLPQGVRQLTQDEIAEMVDKGLLRMCKPEFEPRIIRYDPPPYKNFYDEHRMAALMRMPHANTDTCPDCGNTETEEKTGV